MADFSAQVWNACGYVRLSREDGDKEESNSVTGQKDLIRDFLSRHQDMRECCMKVDDGFTGSNFDRPGFKEMMEEVKAGRINCIVVKDLSRFGREHLDAGEYIERIFPFMGVRFIAINDHYDSLHRNPESDDIIIPFKNEAYCRDTSIKVRSLLEIKRSRGDFIGSSAPYGYKKDPEDHHKLVADTYAADVVRDIFRWKINGLGIYDIAARLNERGVPTPMEYKKQQGVHYDTPFRVKKESGWEPRVVLRILQNPVYIGTLEQGRVTTPSWSSALFTSPARNGPSWKTAMRRLLNLWIMRLSRKSSNWTPGQVPSESPWICSAGWYPVRNAAVPWCGKRFHTVTRNSPIMSAPSTRKRADVTRTVSVTPIWRTLFWRP